MDIQTCPYCRTNVVLTEDGLCPSCQRPIRAQPKQQTASAKSPFAGESFDFRDPVPPTAVSINPYESPKTYGEYAHRTAPLNRGLAWLLFSFDGRIPRRAFWGASLATTFVFYVLLFGLIIVFGEESDATRIGIMVLYIPMVWISLEVAVKRWHDLDKSGWWIFINMIPFIGPICAFIETGCTRGTRGNNRFGPDPN